MTLSQLFGGGSITGTTRLASMALFTANSTTQQVITTSDTVYVGSVLTRASVTAGYVASLNIFNNAGTNRTAIVTNEGAVQHTPSYGILCEGGMKATVTVNNAAVNIYYYIL